MLFIFPSCFLFLGYIRLSGEETPVGVVMCTIYDLRYFSAEFSLSVTDPLRDSDLIRVTHTIL